MRYAWIPLLLMSCKSTLPTCAPHGTPYTVCAQDEQVWQCPEGDADTVAANQAIDDACNQEADPIQCILDAHYEMVEMTLVEDCGAAAQVCFEDDFSDPITATCDSPDSAP